MCYVVDNEDEEQESTMVRYHPENLEQLQSQTHFSRQELQLLYRGFKNVRVQYNPTCWVKMLTFLGFCSLWRNPSPLNIAFLSDPVFTRNVQVEL